jgi:hypothetical protein
MSGILGTGTGNGGNNVWTTNQTAIHPLMNTAQAAYPQTQEYRRFDTDTIVRINRAENGFIVEVGHEAVVPKRYIAKDMDEVRDLITSDMVTRRMEGK